LGLVVGGVVIEYKEEEKEVYSKTCFREGTNHFLSSDSLNIPDQLLKLQFHVEVQRVCDRTCHIPA
jgi:hypothetical protein